MISKGQSRTIEIASMSKVSATVDIFSSDYLVFLYKKAEKIATAVYLVSNLFPDNEPLRIVLRSQSLNLMDNIVSSIGKLNTDYGHHEHKIAGTLLSINSLFEVSFRTGLVSEMNFSILRKELDLLLETISSRLKGRGGKKVGISRDFFSLDNRFFFKESSIVNKKGWAGKGRNSGAAKGMAKPNLAGEKAETSSHNASTLNDTESIKDISNVRDNVRDENIKDKTSDVGTIEKISRKNERREAILSLIKEHRYLTVKELTTILKECGEKTIQRELSELSDKGVLKKEGAKRWMRYFLNTTVR